MFLLDTNIISELMKKQPSSYLLEKMDDVSDTSLYTGERVRHGTPLWCTQSAQR